MSIILASSSIYRLNLLKQINIIPEIIVPDIDESSLLNELPQETSQRLAYNKAKKAQEIKIHHNSNNINTSIIIGSDQVLLLGNELLGKPLNHDNAVKQLRKMRGQSMLFYTSVTMLCENKRFDGCVETKVTMRNYSDDLIEKYLLIEKPYNCAGSAKSEALGAILIKEMISSDPTALVGLPLTKVLDGLEYFNYNII
jgi:septum formation protein